MFAREYENAPEPVIGDDVPESERPVPAEYPTLVTVPVPPVVIETHCMPVPLTYTSAWVPSFAQAGIVLKIGAVVVPVQFPYTVLAAAVVVPPRSDFRVVNGMACAGPGLMPVRPNTEFAGRVCASANDGRSAARNPRTLAICFMPRR